MSGVLMLLGFWTGSPVVLPDPGDVLSGVVYSSTALPAPGDVREGVVYG